MLGDRHIGRDRAGRDDENSRQTLRQFNFYQYQIIQLSQRYLSCNKSELSPSEVNSSLLIKVGLQFVRFSFSTVRNIHTVVLHSPRGHLYCKEEVSAPLVRKGATTCKFMKYVVSFWRGSVSVGLQCGISK